MLFMVIEEFRGGDYQSVRERFVRDGRMLPDGVEYIASWIQPETARCFQVMEAPDAAALSIWIEKWQDLVDFEVVPVLTSQEYWEKMS